MKECFNNGHDELLNRVFETIGQHGEDKETLGVALSQLGLSLDESLVSGVLLMVMLEMRFILVLNSLFGLVIKYAFVILVLLIMLFFKILSKSEGMNTILDLLEAYKWTRDLNVHRNVTFRTFMVIGYAVAGKPDVALQLLARTCFQGHDADAFSYHVLLNSLIEHSFLEAFEVVYKLISSRGFGNAVTRFLKVKYLCKEKLLDEGKGNYCRSGDRFGYAQALSFLVDGFCQNVSLVKAGKLIEEISELGVVPMEPGCGIWLTNLVQARDIDAAFPVPEEQGSLEGCVPDVYQCNFLLFRLLKDNRLEDVYDLLIEMKENQLSTNTFLHECCILLLLQSWNGRCCT